VSYRSKRIGWPTDCMKACFVVVGAVALGFLLSGCGGEARAFSDGQRAAKMGRVSKQELAMVLDAFDESVSRLMQETTQRMYELAPDLKNRRTEVIKSVRLAQAYQSMLAHEDPLIAFVETWGLTVRLVDYFQSGHGRVLYGEHQKVVVKAAQQLETEIGQIGHKFLRPAEFEEAQKQVRQFARQQPINESYSNLVIHATAARPGEPSPFDNIVSIPMAPFTAMKGVDRTASAIYGVRSSMERISDITEDLPESVRWQLLLLLMDLEETEMVTSLLSSTSILSDSSVKLAAVTETLPKELRREASALIEEIDDRQKNIQVTLEKAEATAVALDKGFATAAETIEKTGQAAEAIDRMAQEWESATKATDDLIRSVRQWQDSKPQTSAKPPTTVQDYQETIQGVTKATNELQVLVADVRDLVESEALTGHIDELNGCAAAVADHIAWRLIQVSGVIVLLILAYRFVSLRFLPRTG